MKILSLIMLLSLIVFSACSSKKVSPDDSDDIVALEGDDGTKDSDEIDAEDEEMDDSEELLSEDDSDDESLDASENDSGEETVANNQGESADQEDLVEDQENGVKESVAMNTGDVQQYTVKKGETLMIVSFKLYGDYRKWRKIAQLNNTSRIAEGDVLNYNPPAATFNWSPKGNPYLIRYGDSLSKISKNVYDDYKKWPYIYKNNRPLIKSPDLIFAGFTLYYLPRDQIIAKN